jgi:pimeloyl-ACP methyl ester carboxylesterase
MNSHLLQVRLSFLAVILIVTACAPSVPTVVPTLSNPFDQKIDVGGYALHIVCTGEGTPTVIIETGFGEPAIEKENSSWLKVSNEIAKTTRICRYDRAGLGSSDIAKGKNRTSKDMAKDLHTLLHKAHVPGPYILVGHSIGGYHVLVFAHQYPKEVAGMVLVDSSHPDQWQEISAVLPPESPNEPVSIKNLRTAPPASLPEKMDILESAKEVREVKSLGNLPLVVISHAPTSTIDSRLTPELSAQIQQVWTKLQNNLASLSSNTTHIIATKAGHYIQVDEPQLVIDAILKVIAEIKSKREN